LRFLPAILLAGAFLGLPALAQDTDPEDREETEAKPKKHEGWRFVWKKHPSVRYSDMLRIDFRFRTQNDWTIFDPEVSKTPDLYNLARMRIGVEGNALRILDYEVSYEFAETDFHWKDVYANLHKWPHFEIRGGRFRIPFSLDELTGPMSLDFIERSRIADRLAPARDTGGMVHGTFFKKAIKYQIGGFAHDGDNAADNNNVRTGGPTFAARLLYRPLIARPLFKTLTIGGATTVGSVPEGLYSLRLRTTSDQTIFPFHFVNGTRVRFGAEFSWMPGPFSLKSEFINESDQRLGQGLGGEDLPNLFGRGWYVSGTWAVFGQKRAKGLDRGRYIPFMHGRWGALELAIRDEAIRFASDTSTGRPSRSIRAFNVYPQSNRVWTYGANWYLTQWAKMQANFIRDYIEDDFRAPIPGTKVYWSYKFRLQLQL
jgi:phosphate-selective porin OprO and OprP